MKKKFISICITLILFFTSIVPVFAFDTVAETQVPYWLLDIRKQAFLSHNAADVTFGLAIYEDASHYLVEVVGGGALYLTYEVPAGETVYFRWAIARNNMGNTGASTYVRMSVNGSNKVNHTYNYSNLGDYGTYGSIVMVEDYTNTSSTGQLVTYVIENDGRNPTYEYLPILCGTDVLINQGTTSFSDFDYTVDLTGIEDKLDDIIDLLSNRPTEFAFELPFEMWQYSSFFISNYNYSYQQTYDRIPWLFRNEVKEAEFIYSDAIRNLPGHDYFYFSILSKQVEGLKPILYGNNDTSITPSIYKIDERGRGYGTIVTYSFKIPSTSGVYYSLYLPNSDSYNQFIPLYMGTGEDVTELVSLYTGLNTPTYNRLMDIRMLISNLSKYFMNSEGSSHTNANIANDNLSNTVTEFDNIEKEQVTNFTENIANLPSFDFGSISDFSTTANFISTQMQNIYNSSDYIKFIYTAVLTFGIALVLIGRGLRR